MSETLDRKNAEMVSRGACPACHDFHFTPKDARICQLETQLRAAEEREFAAGWSAAVNKIATHAYIRGITIEAVEGSCEDTVDNLIAALASAPTQGGPTKEPPPMPRGLRRRDMPGINWSGSVKHWHAVVDEWDALCGHAIRGGHGATSDLPAVTCPECLAALAKESTHAE